MSTTRGRFKKLIGSGTDVGTEDVIIGMMTIDIRAAPQNCASGDITFRNCGYLYRMYSDLCPSNAYINVYDMV